jgi:hypothetical protein
VVCFTVFLNGGADRQIDKETGGEISAGAAWDGAELYLVVDTSGARRWIVRVTVILSPALQ